MTDIISNHPIFDSRPDRQSAFRWIVDFGRWLDRAMLARDLRHTLDELPDKVLRDIGVERSEIPSAAIELVSGPPFSPSICRADRTDSPRQRG
jgi:uncharacterized protein YjiS (DUF1127 family)